jgi:superfamily I DNA and RNA helicase
MNAGIVVISGSNKKPVSSEALKKFFIEQSDYQGHLFIGYPIIGTPDGRYPIDALWISKEYGIVIFDLIEGSEIGNYQIRQDDAANKLESKLKNHRELIERRNLLIPINTVSFAPAITSIERYKKPDYALSNSSSIKDTLSQLEKIIKDDLYEKALSAIQSISSIRKNRVKRSIEKEDSRGAKLKNLEDSIATLDSLQSKAVIETVDGVQRIRGLAGSGKTIILALKAAYLHAQHPDWRIAITFNTRALKGQFKRLITTFSIEQTGEEPDWDNLHILNAWGAPGGDNRDGIYHHICIVHDLPYYDFKKARDTFGKGHEFEGACNEALEKETALKSLYQAILVDEAQDFSPAFLKLCYEILDDKKRLVYAYDELQNLSGESMSAPEVIFGKSLSGDIILEKCYRNSRPVLVTAHALGFGIYREPPRRRSTGLVQMFEHSNLWEEIGYIIKSGNLKAGQNVVLCRTEESSPKFLENHSNIDDLVQFISFNTEEEQTKWLVNEITKNLKEDELRHDDIIVINPDPITTGEKVGPIRSRLLKEKINSHLAGVDTNPDIFFETETDSITFTGIHRAKGNEAGMVYIINGQDCQSGTWNLASIRNRLFTALTRSKAWVRVLGIGEGMENLIKEFNSLKANDFELHFKYPTEEELQFLKIIHRDMTPEETRKLKKQEKDLLSLVKDIETGKIHLEDLNSELIKKIKNIFK